MPNPIADNSHITDSATSQFAQIQDGERELKIHYNDAGQGAETVVLLHGSGPGATGWANFNRNVEPLVATGYRVLLMDCPGWGKSDSIVCSTSRSELNARLLVGLLDKLKLDRVHIIGNSMGGHSAVAFALANPQRVDKLVLMGGGTGGASMFAPGPTEGIKLLQALYRDPTIDNLKRMMAVFVFDASSLTDALYQTRLDNLLLGAYQRRRTCHRDQRDTLEEVFALFPRLKERRTQHASTLSGGERQMLAVGRALMAKPRLLMLDEPSLGLAPLIVRDIFRIITALRERGVSILLVEQNARAALQVGDYAYVLENGSVKMQGKAEQLRNDPRVIESYLGLASKHQQLLST